MNIKKLIKLNISSFALIMLGALMYSFTTKYSNSLVLQEKLIIQIKSTAIEKYKSENIDNQFIDVFQKSYNSSIALIEAVNSFILIIVIIAVTNLFITIQIVKNDNA